MKLAHGLSQTLGPAEMRELYDLVVQGEHRAGRAGRAGTRSAADTRDAYLTG